MPNRSTTNSPPLTLKRFWLGGIALLILLLTLIIGNFFIPQSKRLTGGMVGHDFLAFYAAGAFVREGRTHDLYDLEKVKAFQHELAAREQLEIGDSFGPFWNPPFYAWVFVPLAALPYRSALLTWEAINAIAFIAAIALMIRMLVNGGAKLTSTRASEHACPCHPGLNPSLTWRTWVLVPLLLITSMPLIQALTHGQNTPISLFLLCLVATFWQNRQSIPAGLTAGLLLYKPQLGLLVAVAVALTLGWRAVVALAVTGLALFMTTVATLPGVITDYLAKMPGNLRQFQVENVYLWDRHVTLRAFWRLLLQGRAPGEMTPLCKACWLMSCTLIAALLVRAWWNRRKPSPVTDHTLFIAAVIAAMPLLMPFYFDYDLLLISVSALLYAGTRLRDQAAGRHPLPLDRWLTRAWVALYLWLMFNSTIARLTGVNGTVVLLSIVAGLLAHRAGDLPLPHAPKIAFAQSTPPRVGEGRGEGLEHGASTVFY